MENVLILIKTLSCLELENKNLGFSFLNDLQLHYQGDRKVVSLINQIKNFYFPKTSNNNQGENML